MEGRSSQRRTKAEEAEGFRVRGLHLRLEKDVPIHLCVFFLHSFSCYGASRREKMFENSINEEAKDEQCHACSKRHRLGDSKFLSHMQDVLRQIVYHLL